MRHPVLVMLTVLASGLFGCAKGSSFQGTGGDGGGDTTAGGSAGAQTTSTSDAGGAGGASTTSSTTPMCAESPCKLVSPQCGCPAGEMCAIDSTGERECHAEGDKQIDQECVGLYSCAAGSLCVLVSSSKSMCTPYCEDDSQCAGGLCIIELNDPQNPGQVLQGVTMCSDDCDPTTAVGCPPGLGLGCQLGQEQTGAMQVFSVCGGTGPGVQGSTCTDSEDCGIGFGCFNLSDMTQQCLKWCKPAAPSCPGVTQCSPFNPQLIYKGTEFGACL